MLSNHRLNLFRKAFPVVRWQGMHFRAQFSERAIDLGYRDFRWLAGDPDLRDLRKQLVYRRIRVKLRQMRVRVR